MMRISLDESWSMRDLLITGALLVLVTFWILRKRPFRDLVALVLAATVFVGVWAIVLFILHPHDGDWKPLALLDAFWWVAVSIGLAFNKLFRTESSPSTEQKNGSSTSSESNPPPVA